MEKWYLVETLKRLFSHVFMGNDRKAVLAMLKHGKKPYKSAYFDVNRTISMESIADERIIVIIPLWACKFEIEGYTMFDFIAEDDPESTFCIYRSEDDRVLYVIHEQIIEENLLDFMYHPLTDKICGLGPRFDEGSDKFLPSAKTKDYYTVKSYYPEAHLVIP